MPRLRPKTPWFIALELAMAAGRHYRDLSERDRTRLRVLLSKSKGRPSNLTARERDDLKKIARRLDAPGIVRGALPFGGGKRRKRGR